MSPIGGKDGLGSGRWQVRGGVPVWFMGADSTFSSVLTWTRHHLSPLWAFSHVSLIITLQVVSVF